MLNQVINVATCFGVGFLFFFFFNLSALLGLFLWNQAEDGRENHGSPSHADSQMSERRSPVPTRPITSFEELEEEESKRDFIPCFQHSQRQCLMFFTHCG